MFAAVNNIESIATRLPCLKTHLPNHQRACPAQTRARSQTLPLNLQSSQPWIWAPVPESISARNLARQNATCLPQNWWALFWLSAAVVIGTVAFLDRAKPQGGGSIDNIAVAEVPDQNSVLVAVNVTVHNSGEKSLWIHDIKATIKTDSGELSDVAASALDFDRYFQAFPTLKEHALPAIPPETKIPPGGQAQGTVVVSFPVTQDGFDKRKSLSVVIQPYDQPLPLVLTK